MQLLRELLHGFLEFLQRLGELTRFLGRLLWLTPRGLLRPRLVVEQVYNTGALSLVIIMTCGLFVGMVLGLQGYELLERFGSEESLGMGAALALFKELGPVVTALLFAGRAGTALASELGLMRATDQLAAMEIMAVDPMQRVVLPRFLGGVIAMPLLTAIFIAIGIYGVQLVGVQLLGVDQGQFWSQMKDAVELEDVREGLVKGAVFGAACSLIAVFEGYNSKPTAEGVGRATTRTVVISSVVTLVLDYVLTALFFCGRPFMPPSRSIDISTGLFVLLGFAALAFLVTQITSREFSLGGQSYRLVAKYENVGGLKVGAPISMAGVTIGRVEEIGYDMNLLKAVVRLRIDSRYDEIPDDSDAGIFTAGLLGGQYVGISPGGSDVFLKDGDEVLFVQDAIVLENLISKYLFSQASRESDSSAAAGEE